MPIDIDDVISILDEMDMLRVGAEGVWPTNRSESVSEYPVDWGKVLDPRLLNPDEDLLPGDEWQEVLDDLESGAGGEEHTPGDGIIDWVPVMIECRAAGYDAWAIMEYGPPPGEQHSFELTQKAASSTRAVVDGGA